MSNELKQYMIDQDAKTDVLSDRIDSLERELQLQFIINQRLEILLDRLVDASKDVIGLIKGQRELR